MRAGKASNEAKPLLSHQNPSIVISSTLPSYLSYIQVGKSQNRESLPEAARSPENPTNSQRHIARRCIHTHVSVRGLLEHVGLVGWHLSLTIHRGRHQSWIHARRPGLVVRFDTGILNVRIPGILSSIH